MVSQPYLATSTKIIFAAGLCLGLIACSQQSATNPDTATQEAAPAKDKAAKETQAAMVALPLDELRNLATQATREQRLYSPAANNAVEYYLALRKKADKPDPLTESALMDLTPYTVIAAEQAISRSDFEEASRLRDLIAAIDVGAPALPRISLAISEGMKNTDALAIAEAQRQQAITLASEQAKLESKQDALKPTVDTEETKPAVSTAMPPAPSLPPAAIAATPSPGVAAPPRIVTSAPAETFIRKQDLIAIRTPDPAFPSEALNRGLSGAVEIEFIVQTNGDVSEVRVVNSSQRAFDRNVVSTVKRWKFGPLDQPMTVRRSFNFANPS
ncbi:MAG: TonB family protein [Arenimonas sp.]